MQKARYAHRAFFIAACDTSAYDRRGRKISVEHDGKPIITGFENAWNNYGSPVLVFYSYPNSISYSIRLRNVVVEQLDE